MPRKRGRKGVSFSVSGSGSGSGRPAESIRENIPSGISDSLSEYLFDEAQELSRLDNLIQSKKKTKPAEINLPKKSNRSMRGSVSEVLKKTERVQGFTLFIDKQVYTKGMKLTNVEYNTMIKAIDRAAYRSPNILIIRPNGKILNKDGKLKLSTNTNRTYVFKKQYKGNLENIIRKALKRPDLEIGFTSAPVRFPTRTELDNIRDYFVANILSQISEDNVIDHEFRAATEVLGDELLEALINYKNSEDIYKIREAGIARLQSVVGVRVSSTAHSEAQLDAFIGKGRKGIKFSETLDYRILVPVEASNITDLTRSDYNNIISNSEKLVKAGLTSFNVNENNKIQQVKNRFLSSYRHLLTAPIREAATGSKANINAYNHSKKTQQLVSSRAEYRGILGGQQTLFGRESTFPQVKLKLNTETGSNKKEKKYAFNPFNIEQIDLGSQGVRKKPFSDPDQNRRVKAEKYYIKKRKELQAQERKLLNELLKDPSIKTSKLISPSISKRLSKAYKKYKRKQKDVLYNYEAVINKDMEDDLLSLSLILQRDINARVRDLMQPPNAPSSKKYLRYQTGTFANSVKIVDVQILPFGKVTGKRTLHYKLSKFTKDRLTQGLNANAQLLIGYHFRSVPYKKHYTAEKRVTTKGSRKLIGSDLDSIYLSKKLKGKSPLYSRGRDVRRIINTAIKGSIEALKNKFQIIPKNIQFDTILVSLKQAENALLVNTELALDAARERGLLPKIVDNKKISKIDNVGPIGLVGHPDRSPTPVTHIQLSDKPTKIKPKNQRKKNFTSAEQFVKNFVKSEISTSKRVEFISGGSTTTIAYNDFLKAEFGDNVNVLKIAKRTNSFLKLRGKKTTAKNAKQRERRFKKFLDEQSADAVSAFDEAKKIANTKFEEAVLNLFIKFYISGNRKPSDSMIFYNTKIPSTKILEELDDSNETTTQEEQLSKEDIQSIERELGILEIEQQQQFEEDAEAKEIYDLILEILAFVQEIKDKIIIEGDTDLNNSIKHHITDVANQIARLKELRTFAFNTYKRTNGHVQTKIKYKVMFSDINKKLAEAKRK